MRGKVLAGQSWPPKFNRWNSSPDPVVEGKNCLELSFGLYSQAVPFPSYEHPHSDDKVGGGGGGHTFNSKIWRQADLYELRAVQSTYRVPGQPGRHRETLSQANYNYNDGE